MRRIESTSLLVVIFLTFSIAAGQTPPDGCTIPFVPDFYGKELVQEALDTLLAGACGRHDLCYRDCLSPLAIGFDAHKLGCDDALLLELTAWCGASTVITAIVDGGLDPEEFGPACEAAMLTIYLAERGSAGQNAYEEDQCPACEPVNHACCEVIV